MKFFNIFNIFLFGDIQHEFRLKNPHPPYWISSGGERVFHLILIRIAAAGKSGAYTIL